MNFHALFPLRQRLNVYLLHNWTDVHQSHALIDRDSKAPLTAGCGTADFIQKYSHSREN